MAASPTVLSMLLALAFPAARPRRETEPAEPGAARGADPGRLTKAAPVAATAAAAAVLDI